MTSRMWIILGATSIIAKHFAHKVAKSGHSLRLVGRDKEQLDLIAQDIQLRYHVSCDVLTMDTTDSIELLLSALFSSNKEMDLFIAHSEFTTNDHLDISSISTLIKTNVVATALIINSYLNLKQTQYNVLYLSSVAACRGRAKNSLYGGTKAAIEVYLQGLQQEASENTHITIARLGFIDTKQTYGLPGIFYAAPPEHCAQACWQALYKKKRMIYFPSFWGFIMAIITRLPFVIYKRMDGL
jgi:short-subunit dehydrogenase